MPLTAGQDLVRGRNGQDRWHHGSRIKLCVVPQLNRINKLVAHNDLIEHHWQLYWQIVCHFYSFDFIFINVWIEPFFAFQTIHYFLNYLDLN
jgi:hypothetical protein